MKYLFQRLIVKFYKSKYLKILYGMRFGSSILEDEFAKSHGIIEAMAHYKLLNEPKISSSFVKKRFNNSSIRYEKTVSSAGFEGGEMGLLVSTLNDVIAKEKPLNCLDLGCGSGLVGPRIRSKVECLVGVDLSEKMLELASSKNAYSELHCEDIQDYLTKETRIFDLIFACSVVQFFDDIKLNQLLDSVSNRLSPNGVFVFTFDICRHSYNINSKLTMEHSRDYMDKTVNKYFKNIEIQQIKNGRFEQNKEVMCGLVIVKNTITS